MVVKLNFVEHSWLAHKNLYNIHGCHNRICTILLVYTNFCRTFMVVRLKSVQHLWFQTKIFRPFKYNIHGGQNKFFSKRFYQKYHDSSARWC